MNYINVQSINCLKCGAGINSSGKDKERCTYCGTEIFIVKPIKIGLITNSELNDAENKSLKAIISIMENSMLAGNYKEAYDYCNKALEIAPTQGDIWENKAIASFMIRSDFNVWLTNARETITYLNTAETYNPDSKSIKETKKDIAWNIYYLASNYYNDVRPINGKQYSNSSLNTMFECIKMIDITFALHQDNYFLKMGLNQLKGVNKAKVNWSLKNLKKQFPVDAMVDSMVNRIKKTEPNFIAPERTFFQNLFGLE